MVRAEGADPLPPFAIRFALFTLFCLLTLFQLLTHLRDLKIACSGIFKVFC